MIQRLKDFINRKRKTVEVQEDTKVIREFNIDEFNEWFNNDFDGYDGRKGAKGIFLRTDKFSPIWVEEYLKLIGQDSSFENVYHYADVIRTDWMKKISDKYK